MRFKQEEGLSLAELLAALAIASIIAVVAYSVLFSGFGTYKRVKTEADLRDEADYIMAELMSDLFTLKASDIQGRQLPEAGTNNYYLILEDGQKIGFYEGEIYGRKGKISALVDENIELSPETSMVEVSHGQFHIHLTLIETKSEQELTTESEIAVIVDKNN